MRDFIASAATGTILGGLALSTVASCSDLAPAIHTANVTRTTGHALAAVVTARCAEPYARAADMPAADARAEVARLDALRCPEALRAQTALSEAHGAMVALLVAVEAGQCQATVAAPAPARCDLGRATMALVSAGARLARAVDALGAPQ